MRTSALLLTVGLSVSLLVVCASAAPAFTPLPLGKGANTAFADQTADDRQGGWTDQGGNDLAVLKPGTLTISGIPFNILSDAETRGKSCIVLGGPKRDYLPQSAKVPVDNLRGTHLYLLHAAVFAPPAKDLKMTGCIFVEYADGSKSEFHVRFGRDVADWTKPDGYKNAIRVWTEYNNNTQVSLFASKFKLKDQPVKRIRLEARESTWMVVAATLGDDTRIVGIKKALTLDQTFKAPALAAPLAAAAAGAKPKNVILVIGDGMGPGAVKLTSLYQHRGQSRLVMEQLPVAGFCTTVNVDAHVTDSAASSTALATGIKTKNSHLGLNPEKRYLTSVAAVAHQQGKAVGLITSDSITGVTPAGFYAHVPARGLYSNIAVDAAASGYEILIGNANGKPWFLPKDKEGKRTDSRNVCAEMEAAGYTVIENYEAFEQTPLDRHVLGFMAKGTLDDENCLGRLTEAAIARLTRNDKGFFMMVECAMTDGGGHGNKPDLTVRGTLQIDWAVHAAVEFARRCGDTLVLVTADHETGALTVEMKDGKLVFDYATTSHTDIPVCIFAYGPGAERFGGTIDNTDVAKNIADLLSLTLPPPGDIQPEPAK
ncbi:MAG TPA: alkaline phosphatase [Kiritimatiellia bacterium]|nr:alkaline phosphatase [Kiritimatiellia bacterium]HRU69978.1 alkaline phosphatase [Kiritimatiellia bacterium]